MNFIEAVKLLRLDRTNKLMRKAEWYHVGGKNYDALITNNYMTQSWGDYKPTIEDVLAEDWYVVKDEKLHTFEEALKAYKSGQDIRRKNCETNYHDSDCDFRKDDVMTDDWIIINENDTK